MIGKTIICFLKRNILYFLGQNQYFFQHLHKNGCVCVCAERRGRNGHRKGKVDLAASGGPQTRRGGGVGTPDAQSGGGVGSAEWGRGGYTYVAVIGFRLQGTIPPLPRPNLLQAFCTLQNRIRLHPISTVNSFYKIVPQNCKKRGVKEGKWGSLQWILDVLI